MFHVGQLVQCIRDDWLSCFTADTDRFPVKGEILVVRGCTERINGTGLIFEEIRGRIMEDGKEAAFVSFYFRPLVDTALDVFRKLVAPAPKVREDA